ncbi:MAG TPA: hypothetical protein VGK41_01330 [Solirubrobacterales bacterium]
MSPMALFLYGVVLLVMGIRCGLHSYENGESHDHSRVYPGEIAMVLGVVLGFMFFGASVFALLWSLVGGCHG